MTPALPWRGLDTAGDPLVVRIAERRDAPRFIDHKRTIVSETDRLLQSEEDELPDIDTQRAILAHFSQRENSLCLVAHRPGVFPGRGRLLGSLTLLGGMNQRTEHVSRLGMGVVRTEWRRGIGRRMVELALHWARHNERVEPLTLQVYSSNGPARTLYDTVGFLEDGCLVREVRLEDRFEDLVTMSMCVDERAAS